MFLNASPVLAFSDDASLSEFAHSWVIDKPKWRNGRRGGLKNRWELNPVSVRLRPSAPSIISILALVLDSCYCTICLVFTR